MAFLRFSLVLAFVPLSAEAQDDHCTWLYQPKPEAALVAKVGHAALYPMDSSAFVATFNCLFASYAQTKISLAGFTWDVTHALLRMMSADPEQFMKLYSVVPTSQSRNWRQSFVSAALWPGEKCPMADPMKLAAISLRSARLPASSEAHRQEVLSALAKAPCRVAQ